MQPTPRALLAVLLLTTYIYAKSLILSTLPTDIDLLDCNSPDTQRRAGISTIQLGGLTAVVGAGALQTTGASTHHPSASARQAKQTSADEAVTVIGTGGKLVTIGSAGSQADAKTATKAAAGKVTDRTVTVTKNVAPPTASQKQKQVKHSTSIVLVTVTESGPTGLATAVQQESTGKVVTVTKTITVKEGQAGAGQQKPTLSTVPIPPPFPEKTITTTISGLVNGRQPHRRPGP